MIGWNALVTYGFDASIPTDESAYARKLLLVQMLPMVLMSVDQNRSSTYFRTDASSPSRSISTSGCAARSIIARIVPYYSPGPYGQAIIEMLSASKAKFSIGFHSTAVVRELA